MAAPTADRHRVVIGCGINLRLEPQDTERVDQLCSTVSDHIDVTRNGLVARLLDSMLPALVVFEDRGFAPFATAWADYDLYAGAHVGILSGGDRVEGVNVGIDGDGNLLLDTAEGRRTFNAGEVSLRPVAEAP
ncbi:MAG: biotin--[acetyl-CoA-carboxylase] ligase [Gammaproteobacteria bacterium]|nr:biotin--[acetyl-CoA-carboxylase] ligase [Gammaproteobacteria bacterium]